MLTAGLSRRVFAANARHDGISPNAAIRTISEADIAVIERLFSVIRWIPVDEGIARHAGSLGRRYHRSHAGIGAVDLIIAATALELSAPLATINVRHFPMFEGLRPPY